MISLLDPELRLDEEQAMALKPHVRHIEAGPGAGKTKTMVARFRARVRPDAGVALLSFTNAAVNVARNRCLDEPQLLDSPNFVGTFDSFFHRYVVTPAILRTTGATPRYLRSWDDLPDDLRIVRLRPGAGVRLSRWVRQPDDSIQLDETQLGRTERQFWENQNLSKWTREQMRKTGTDRVVKLLNRSIYDASEARRIAIKALERRDLQILEKLALRFKEVIVDEFQDCDDLEHQLLHLLREAGIHIVTVADPDQAIYEFRQVGRDSYERYLATVNTRETVHLATCYRSTPAICTLVTSLRQVSTIPVVSHLPADMPCPAIQVIVGSGAKAGAAAVRLVSAHGIALNTTRFIAHKKQDARRLVHSSGAAIEGGTAVTRILASVTELSSGADARTRHAAITRIEKLLLELFDWGDAGPPSTRTEQLEKLGVTGDQLRIIVSEILSAAPGWSTREACSASIRATVKGAAQATAIPLISTLNNRLAKPNEKIWDVWVSRSEDVLLADIQAVKWTHVHAVKGEEFDSIIYALPSKAVAGSHVLDDWEQGYNTEARRVLYVGASRARQMLALVVSPSRRDQLLRVLDRDNVPYKETVA